MKIIYSTHYKSYIAVPENRTEEAKLISGHERPKQKTDRPTKNVWKGKHSKECPDCGVSFKNFGRHVKAKHLNAARSLPVTSV